VICSTPVCSPFCSSGAACQTQVTTDGGYVAAQGAIAVCPPLTPTGLAAGTVAGLLVPVHWNENTEPDVWGIASAINPLPLTLAARTR